MRRPDWDLDRLDGEAGEHLVAHLLRSDNIEVKHDLQAMTTGQLYIETECLYRTGWGPSGITTTKADAWFFVLDLASKVTLSVDTQRLKQEVDYYKDKRPLELTDGSHQTKGVGVPLTALTREKDLHFSG